MTSPAPEPLVDVIEDVVGAVVESSPVLVDLVDVGKLLVERGPAIVALIEAFRGGTTTQQAVDAIKNSMVVASDAVVEAELGPHP